jgi:hypothetical protein
MRPDVIWWLLWLGGGRFLLLQRKLESPSQVPEASRRICGAKAFDFEGLVDFLKKRFREEMAAVLKEKIGGRIRFYVESVGPDGRVDAVEELPQFAVTGSRYFGDDGLLRQSTTSTQTWRMTLVEKLACKPMA